MAPTVVESVSWMLLATNVARADEHVQAPAASSWMPMKWATRHEATASVGDHELPPRPPRLRSRGLGPRHSEFPRWRVHGRRGTSSAIRRTRCIRVRLLRRYIRFRRRRSDRNELPCPPCSQFQFRARLYAGGFHLGHQRRNRRLNGGVVVPPVEHRHRAGTTGGDRYRRRRAVVDGVVGFDATVTAGRGLMSEWLWSP